MSDTTADRRRSNPHLTAFLFVASILATGCSDSNDDSGVAGGNGNGDGPSAAYLFRNFVQTPQGDRTMFVHVVPSVDSPLDLSNALEVSAGGRTDTYGGKVFVYSDDDLTITKYVVGDDLTLTQEGERLSFLGTGISFFDWAILHISETRAYYIDGELQRVIVWNPSIMEIVSEFPVPDLSRFAYLGEPKLSLDGSRVFVPNANIDWDNLRTEGGSELIILSATEDRIIAHLEDDRCGGTDNGFVDAATGDYYLAGHSYYGYGTHFMEPGWGDGCFLRVPAGTDGFDPDWVRFGADMNPSAFTDFGVSSVAEDGRILVAIRDEALAPVADLDLDTYFGDSAWRPYVGSISGWNVAQVNGDGISEDQRGLISMTWVVDGELLFTVREPDRSSADIFRVSEAGEMVLVTESTGWVESVERIL